MLLEPVMICGSQMYHIYPFWFACEGVHPADTPQKACTGVFWRYSPSQVPGRDGEMVHLREGTYISGDTYFPR